MIDEPTVDDFAIVYPPKFDDLISAAAVGDLDTVIDRWKQLGDKDRGGVAGRLMGQLATTALRERLNRERAAHGWTNRVRTTRAR